MRIAVLTGAGISAESGVPTFRGSSGLWRTFKPEELATPQAFEKDPKLVWEWYDWRRSIIRKAKPNKGHILIAHLEQLFEDFLLITQNVDGLHRKAGSKKVIELHGNIWRVLCTVCGKRYYNYQVPLEEIPPRCKYCKGLLRPDVVWFGESLPKEEWETALEFVSSCSMLLVVGTSGVVYPVAWLPFLAKQKGAKVVEINPEDTPISQIAHIRIKKKASEGMEEFFKML
ncbi:MAG: SIR2 family NAD-dependent protein deacylase [Hydrogenobacter sp.]